MGHCVAFVTCNRTLFHFSAQANLINLDNRTTCIPNSTSQTFTEHFLPSCRRSTLNPNTSSSSSACIITQMKSHTDVHTGKDISCIQINKIIIYFYHTFFFYSQMVNYLMESLIVMEKN